jgi:hypothetical protein
MEPDRWKQIERLYHAALELAPDARGTFLVQACGGDEEMRGEFASLLNYDDGQTILRFRRRSRRVHGQIALSKSARCCAANVSFCETIGLQRAS